MHVVDRVRGLHERSFSWLERRTDTWLLGTLARLVFFAVLALFFWQSAWTKLGEGLWGFILLSKGAYFQIVPWAMEAASYNPANLGPSAHFLVVIGTWMEFILPFLVVIGLFTRLASLGLVGFIAVLTYVDLAHHSLKPEVVGSLFDRALDGLWDQRVLWVFLLLVLVLKGPGPLSLDRLIGWLLERRPHGPPDEALARRRA